MIIVPAAMFGVPSASVAGSALYIGSGSGSGTGSVISTANPATLGAIAGDMAILILRYGRTPSSGSGAAWTDDGSVGSGGGGLYWKIMATADLTAPVTFARSTFTGYNRWSMLIYRGPASLATVVSDQHSTGSYLLAGVSKSVGHLGFVGIAVKDQRSGGTASAIGSPANFAQRLSDTDTQPGNQRILRVFDRLYPPNAEYINATGFGVTAGTNADSTFAIIELKSV